MKDSKLYKAVLLDAHSDCVKAQRILLRSLKKASVRSCVASQVYLSALVKAKALVAALESVKDLNESQAMIF